MTYCTRELVEHGVEQAAIEWRRWRRGVRITQAEAASLAGVNLRALIAFELGERDKYGAGIADKLSALSARWQEHMRPIKVERRGGCRKRKAAAA